jgi:hypothetical protein
MVIYIHLLERAIDDSLVPSFSTASQTAPHERLSALILDSATHQLALREA